MNRLPICVDCQLEMTPKRNHFVLEIMAADQPYMKVAADKFACPNCDFEIVTGFAKVPLAEHWQLGYSDVKADLQVWGSLKDKKAGQAE